MAEDQNNGQALTGAPFGAFRFATLERLFGSQRLALVAIVQAVHRIAADSFARRRGKPSGPLSERDLLSLDQDAYFDRPHHAFVIDGERGSGKTTVLLTLYAYIRSMRLDNALAPAPEREGDTIRADLAGMGLPPVAGAQGNERTALLLPIVFPETMEPHESAMEAILAHMDQVLVKSLEDERIGDDRRRRLEELQDWLRRRIGSAWMYSRKIGEQALANDALTFDEFVVRRAEHNRQSYTRIDTWRYFVDQYLDELGYEILVLSFDDSDLVPESADDIMRTIRVYLSHSRIVSLMAVELRTLQDALSLFKLTQRSPGLLDGQGVRLGALMELEDGNVAAQLDKVLPTGLRHRLETAADQLDKIFVGGFETFCRAQFRQVAQSANGDRDAVSWWLLAGNYDGLVSDTVRRIVSVHAAATRPGRDLDRILMDYSKLRGLGRLVEGRVSDIRDAIMRGKLRRAKTPLGKGYYEEDLFGPAPAELSAIEASLVEFSVDRDLALRKLDASAVPQLGRWLAPGGDGAEEEADARPFDARAFDDAARSIGVTSLFPGMALPRNCLYLCDLAVLDEADWRPPNRAPTWIARFFHRARPGAGEGVRQDIDYAIQMISTLDDTGALGWLLFQFETLRKGALPSQRSVTLRRIMTNPIVAPDVLLLILRAVLKGRGGSRSELVGALRAVAEDEFGAIDRDDPVDEDISEFLLRADATRILAVRTWINALKVARGRRGVGIRSRVAAQDDGGALVSGPALFQDTIDILTDAEDPRAGALLGWSLGPCLAPAFDYGFVVGSLTPTRDNWEKLTLALQASAGSMRPARRRDAKVGRAGQRWLFPDIIDDDRDVMAVTIETLAATIAGRLGAERPAGVPLAPGAWPARSEDLLASLLGVTVRALEDEDVVQPG